MYQLLSYQTSFAHSIHVSTIPSPLAARTISLTQFQFNLQNTLSIFRKMLLYVSKLSKWNRRDELERGCFP